MRQRLFFAALLACLAGAAPAQAAILLDLTPTWTNANHARVFIGGGGDQNWINYDNAGSTGGANQQWQWLDFSSTLPLLTSRYKVLSATLQWRGNKRTGSMNNDVVWSVFAVEGTDRGRAAVIAAGGTGRNGADVPDYYASHTAYGAVTTGQIGTSTSTNLVSWDVTELVRGWDEGVFTENVGQMIVLNDRNQSAGPPAGSGHGGSGSGFSHEDWINWGTSSGFTSAASAGPQLVVTAYAIPEPATWLLLAGVLPLLRLVHQRRKAARR